MKQLIALLSLFFCACTAYPETPPVDPGTSALPAGAIVKITAEGDLNPPCLVIKPGDTVEFRNYAPEITVNVTSLTEPPELYSPTLVAPYPNVGEDESGRYIWWRHTFNKVGVFEYYDTFAGDPGKKVVDPYYGTVTFVGLSANLKTGVVCAREPGSAVCLGVCCKSNFVDDGSYGEDECPKAQCCDPEAKRCRTGTPLLQVCAGKPALREFKCLIDNDCPVDQSGNVQQCLIDPEHSHNCD